MTTNNETANDDLVVQEHCIDLPGESVQCWIGGGVDKLKVILRKHRDVIFDIQLHNGKTYTLESTESDFYNPRDKKLVYAHRHEKVTFKDGERMHVWVSRGFRGALILKCGDHVMSDVKPNEWDTQRHSDDPKAKPPPIIVAIVASTPVPTPTAPATRAEAMSPHDEEPSLHVHEVSKKGAPLFVLKFFEEGGESLHLDSENILTRNWIIAQLAGAGAYVFDNHTWIKELMGRTFYLKKVVHRFGPKVYIIFNGNNRIREVISASKYQLYHTKIIRITGGAGGAKQAWDTAKGAAKDSIKVFAKEEGKMVLKGGGVAVVFTIGIDIAEWHKDYSEIGPDGKPKKDYFDLFAKVGIDIAKAGLVAALTTATVAALFSGIVTLGVAATAAAAAPVAFVVVGTIFVGIAMAYAVDRLDKAVGHALGSDDTTTWFAKRFRETAEILSQARDARYKHYADLPILR